MKHYVAQTLFQLNPLKTDFYCCYFNILVSVLTHGTISDTPADEQSELRTDTEDEPRERTPENAYDIIK